MSAPTAAPARPGRRPTASTLLIALGLVLAVVLAVGRRGRPRTTGVARYLDPDNPDPDGAQAVARVLEDQGVDVTVVRSADALDDAEVDAGTTVVVTSTEQLGRSTPTGCSSRGRRRALVLVEPGPGTTAALGVAGCPTRAHGSTRPSRRTAPTRRSTDSRSPSTTRLAYPLDDGCFAHRRRRTARRAATGTRAVRRRARH